MSRLCLLLLASMIALFGAPRHALAAPVPPVFESNGHLVYGPFFAFFQAHGGEAIFGPPLSDPFHDPELGLTVQVFRYARMERHGEQVLLSRLGSAYAAGRAAEPAFQWRTADAAPAGYQFIPESGHTLGGAFAWYHQRHGGVAVLGYPISEEFYEAQPEGDSRLVQYFERAVLIYDPAAASAADDAVQRLPLGAWVAATLPSAVREPRAPLTPLAQATIAYPAGGNDGANIELAAQRLHGAYSEPGAQLSFLASVGPISAEAGYRPGSAIVNGAVVTDTIGGGICTVATLLYRAGWAAGLPVLERRAHRYALRAYADAPGFDAAVYAPKQDLRLANDTAAPIFVAVHTAGGVATLTLWGRADGRSVRQEAPVISADGLGVQRTRTIRLADGRQQRETVTTRYEPLPPPPSTRPAADTAPEPAQNSVPF
jgi:hypothetical protein